MESILNCNQCALFIRISKTFFFEPMKPNKKLLLYLTYFNILQDGFLVNIEDLLVSYFWILLKL